ncbi:Hsp20/alpha crystallin family [Fragilaria crotonensis]|nr:Hsp20/alpha crystallin family [Fragilaria crotonensis]
MTCGSFSTLAFHPVIGSRLHLRHRRPDRCKAKFTLRRFPGHAGGHQNLQVRDLGDKVQLSIDLPGVKASALKVQVEDKILSVSASRDIHTEYGLREVEYHRRFRLDDSIDSQRATANLAEGVLILTAPKIQKAGSRTIPITTNDPATTTDKQGDRAEEGDDDVVLVDAPDSTATESAEDKNSSADDDETKKDCSL